MFTLLTGPGYDADGDLSWGAHWDSHAEHDWTADGCPEEDRSIPPRYRVAIWYWSSSTHEQRSCPRVNASYNIHEPW